MNPYFLQKPQTILAVMEIRTVLLKKKKKKSHKNKYRLKTTGGYAQGTFPSVIPQIFFLRWKPLQSTEQRGHFSHGTNLNLSAASLSLSDYPQSHLGLCLVPSTPRLHSAACWGFLWRSGTLVPIQDTAGSPLSPPPATTRTNRGH